MTATTSAVGSRDTRSTALIIIVVGGFVTILQALATLLVSDWYLGEFLGLSLTETEIVVIVGVGLLLAIVYLWYVYSIWGDPTPQGFMIILVLAVISAVIGILIANVITVLGAGIGYWRETQQRQRLDAM